VDCDITHDAAGNQVCTYPDKSYEMIEVATFTYKEFDTEGRQVYEENLKEVFDNFNAYHGAVVYSAEGDEISFNSDGTIKIVDPETGVSTLVDPSTLKVKTTDISGATTLAEEDLTYSDIWDFIDNLEIDYVEFNFDLEVFCESYPDMCIDGAPDIVAVCDDITRFPPEYFAETGINELCEVDLADACNSFPELCTTEGTFNSDVCGAYPEKCDETSAEYDPCASDLYACVMDPEFDVCDSFPEICGIPEEVVFPMFTSPQNSRGSEMYNYGESFEYVCLAHLSAPVNDVLAAVKFLEQYYDFELGNADEGWDYYETSALTLGARLYKDESDVEPTVLGDATDVTGWAYYPYGIDDLVGDDHGEKEDFGDFEDLFEPSLLTKYDLLFEDVTFDETGIQQLQAGYRIVETGDDEPEVFFGFNFATEVLESQILEGAEVIQWVTYEMFDESDNLLDSGAVACNNYVY